MSVETRRGLVPLSIGYQASKGPRFCERGNIVPSSSVPLAQTLQRGHAYRSVELINGVLRITMTRRLQRGHAYRSVELDFSETLKRDSRLFS